MAGQFAFVDVRGETWDKLQAISRVSTRELERTLLRGMQLLTDKIMEEMPPYPPQRTGQAAKLPKVYSRVYTSGPRAGQSYKSGFKTLKQQRYFFWARKQGIIRVPYKRKHSAGIGGSIGGEAWIEGGDVIGAVGVNEAYAPYARKVIGGDDEQAEYHKGHWWQFEPTVMAIYDRVADEVIDKAVDEAIARLIG